MAEVRGNVAFLLIALGEEDRAVYPLIVLEEAGNAAFPLVVADVSMPIYLQLPEVVQRFERGDKIVYINPDIPSWVVTNHNGDLVLSLCHGEYSTDDIVDQFRELYGTETAIVIQSFIKKTIESRLFDSPPQGQIPILRKNGSLNIVQFSISDTCNLNCRYCYATDRKESGQDKMRYSDYVSVIDDITSHFDDVLFTITGGEPLLNKDCFSIAEYIKSKGCYVDLLTNGTLINAGNIDKIKSFFDRVTLSIDGSSRDKHEFFRGKGSYERAQQSIDLLKTHDIPYELSMTVNRINIKDVEQMALKYGSHLRFAPLFPVGNANKSDVDLTITGLEYYNALKSAPNVNPLSFCEDAIERSKECRACKCAVGNQELSISATGDVYPCQLLHYPEFLIGNIHSAPISELWHNSSIVERCARLTVDAIEGCKDCAFKYICGGACRARAFHECGRVDVCGRFCEYEKEAYLQGIIDSYSNNLLDSDKL